MPLAPVPEFWITQANYIGLYTLVVIGLVLLTGIAGLTSFGQAAFVGIGAYTAAYLTLTYGISPWFTVWIGLVLTAIAALGLAWVTLADVGPLPAARDHRLGPEPLLPARQPRLPRQVRRPARHPGDRASSASS